jgi:hypothetical protein
LLVKIKSEANKRKDLADTSQFKNVNKAKLVAKPPGIASDAKPIEVLLLLEKQPHDRSMPRKTVDSCARKNRTRTTTANRE